ncbi:LD-carboxypeptidase [Ichthyenterobacterium sp. W332]|uniref:LD-carboxypeptidase n=1 Tax=Microcosmobacter mediterraneus TaxID=3075607 RepID=A0ABU2YIW5_9FLAO|nr:LD-carboxypeptidase [Ichthyenterobacterium sp. W332]MDT0557982.1 LD-carboxypeptidase [Ichthyenterobacterium sp. W332]
MSKYAFFISVIASLFLLGIKQRTVQQKNAKTQNTLIQPPYLKAGDTVAIVAPSGVLINRGDEITQAKKLLENWNLNVIIGKNVFNQNNHFAGTDDERCEDLQNAMDNPTISAIWCARGGYGTVRILDKLDYTKFRNKPKWLLGYSDITALHNQLHNKGFETIHALMCTSLTKDLTKIKPAVNTFKDALFGKSLSYTLEGSKLNKTGEVSGQLVGGNLTLLHTMLGSDTSINTSGKILFIEDIGEYKYHIDRMLQTLKRAGYFDNCKGVLVGDFTKMKKNNTALWGSSIEQLIIDALSEYNFPIAFNMPAGHEKDNRAMILGREIQLNVSHKESTILFKN